nr:MAG TPA: Putative ATP dependent Clp protease [Caudoviricetes sp.]
MPRTYHIDIDSYIGYPISAAYIKQKLSPLRSRPVTVRINSYGGDVMTALDIRQQFIDHGQVTAYILGMTASAATILAMGAKKVVMSRYALMLVHPTSTGVTELGMYNHDQLEEAIQRLRSRQADIDSIDSVISAIYAEHAHGRATQAQMASLMAEARWLTAQEALEAGLIDEIDESAAAPDSTQASALFSDHQREIFAACGLPLPVASAISGNMEDGAPASKEDAAPAPEEEDGAPASAEDGAPASDTSFFARLRAFFASLLEEHSEEGNAHPCTYNSSSVNHNPDTPMSQKTTYPILQSLLADASITPEADGSITFSSDALSHLEQALAQMQADKTKAAEDLAAARSELEQLKQADGATSASVKPSPEEEDAAIVGSEASDFFARFSNII